MAYKLIKKPTIGGNVFEKPKNFGQRVQLATVSENNLYAGLTLTAVAVTATAFDMKHRDIINIGGQKLTLNADVAATSTSLPFASTVLDFDINFNANVEIDPTNLFVQYQRKTEGKIGGMDVVDKGFGPINFDSPATGDYSIIGVDPTYVKILPRDFMVNDDASTIIPALQFKDGTSNSGLTVEDASQEMVATVNIPYRTTATEVTIWGSVATKAVEVYECGVDTNGIGSNIGTGLTDGSAIDITDTAATATNYLLILVKVSATSQRIYGGQVTLTQN